jgi:hypothetical protein
VSKLFDELGPRYSARPGGYLRILKFGFRIGDNAPMALVELMDRPEPGSTTEEDGEGREKAAQDAKGRKAAKSAKAAKKPKAAKTAKKDTKSAKEAKNARTAKAAA